MSRRGFDSARLRWIFVASVAVFALAGGLAACGDDDDDGGGGDSSEAKSIYLNAYAQEIPYFRDWQAGATAKAEELGWDVTGEYGNTTPEQQVQQVENALVQQPDAMVITPIDEESLVPALQQASDQDIAVITLGATVSDPNVITSFVARDNYDIGKQKAEYVVEQLGGKGKVGIIHGIRGLTFSEEQAKAYEDVLSAESGIEVVDGPYTGGFSADLGLDATANMLTSNPDLNAIIYDNDDLALGGAEAVRNAGINLDDIVIVGTDGGEPALDAVEDGTIDMTISLCGFREGSSAIDTLNTFYEDGEVEDRIVSEVEVFTTENAADKRAELDQRIECN
ncbi:MAG: ribose transporter, substrate binding protein [Solirubrobacterales bacterium]|jgi:ABC-type sugar transport system substrate-binding protein|nr:ribose transporter, substrate binding protein [Solirubrobacterales bacterium]